jgi:hypothetical protein
MQIGDRSGTVSSGRRTRGRCPLTSRTPVPLNKKQNWEVEEVFCNIFKQIDPF